ncbi:putative ubiquitin-conjugating enzyme e2z protein [Eutypa lata UCREL1]|uniref:Putative ubiquitin-conjugating enzyme e2z protein n=1 Tax=Eutypa lata (strain UCR-EL1) TaxID=1287681 RepID=M7T8Q7_EUTLA|nr:putative ubiquitin-conjugating enzyme e2z protein [Eutypa lata UCREL1]
MATPLPVKRMTKERQELEKENSDYFVHFKDDNLLEFDAYIIGPDDSLYQHKLIKLRLKIPDRYPMVPPTVTFVQHSGHRIHPNLYVEGKVCLSILGTWAGEPWAFVLITIRSLLDNEPYKHEPGCKDNPQFNQFVEYSTWQCLLLDYLRKETSEPAKEFLQKHLRERGSRMMDELRRQQAANSQVKQFTSPYRRGLSNTKPEYPRLIQDLGALIAVAQVPPAGSIKRPLELPRVPASDAHHTSDKSDRRPPKRAKKESSTQVIDLTGLTSSSDSSDSEAKKGAPTGKARSVASKGSNR